MGTIMDNAEAQRVFDELPDGFPEGFPLKRRLTGLEFAYIVPLTLGRARIVVSSLDLTFDIRDFY